MFCFALQRPEPERLGLAVEFHDRGLIHVAKPQIAVAIAAQAEPAGRKAWLVLEDRKFGHLARLGVETPKILLAETGIPNRAIAIDDHVMRRDRLARQIVFGIDDASGRAARARQRLEFEIPLRMRTQVYAGQEFGVGAVNLDALIAALLHQAFGFAQLRVLRNALVHIALHARQDDVHELVGAEFRAQRAFQRVAADAIEQLTLLPIGAGHAGEPFGVRHLRRQIFGFAQSEIGRRRLVCRDRDRAGMIEVVTNGPDAQGILAGLQSGGREGVTAVFVAHHRDGDGGTALLGADQDAFQRALLGGDFAGERRCDGLCRRSIRGRQQSEEHKETDARKYRTTRHDYLPSDFVCFCFQTNAGPITPMVDGG